MESGRPCGAGAQNGGGESSVVLTNQLTNWVGARSAITSLTSRLCIFV